MTEDVENKEQEKQAQPASNGWQIINFDGFKNPPIGLAASIYVLGAIFALGVLVLVGFGLFASFEIAYEATVGVFEKRIEAAKVFFPILLALVGGPLLIWRVVTAHMQATAAHRQADVAQEGFYTSLFTKAVEQLGATREVKTYQEINDGTGSKRREAVNTTEPNLEVRLGAIYALDRVARDSERDHWPILEVMCAYARNPQNSDSPILSPDSIEPVKFHEWLNLLKPPRVDVQATLTVIGQRAERGRQFETKRGLRLDLRRANLQKAVLEQGEFDHAFFDSAHLDGASLRGGHFVSASFDGAHLVGARLNEAFLSGASFFDANLLRARFNSANLSGCSFVMANLSHTNFLNADISNASFFDANLSNASFRKARLSGVSFHESELTKVSFRGAHIAGARFFDVDLSTAEGLDASALVNAFGDSTTRLPEGMARPATWQDRELSWDERDAWIKTGIVPSKDA